MPEAIRFQVQWASPAGAKGKELRATWASLKIAVGDRVITEIFDGHTRSESDQLFMPLYPLAEWIVDHWWHLTVESFAPNRSTSDSYPSRHNFICGSEGYALPDIVFFPQGDVSGVSWTGAKSYNTPVRFLSSGTALISTLQLRDELTSLIDSVVQRLSDSGIKGSYLQEEWQGIADLDLEEVDFCESIARMGLDPFSVEEDFAGLVQHAGNTLPSSIRNEFFNVVEPNRFAEGLEVFKKRMSQVKKINTSALSPARDSLRSSEQLPHEPWRRGYAVARFYRELLERDHAMKIGSDRFFKDVQSVVTPPKGPRNRDDNWLEGLAHLLNDNLFAVTLPPMHRQKSKFASCRVLSEYLTAPEDSWRMLSPSRTDEQAVNRAFAAEFLVPAHELKERVMGRVIGIEEVEDIADEYGVSSWVVRHQVENHQLATIYGNL